MRLLALLILFFISEQVFPQPVIRQLDNYLTLYYKNKNIPSISAGVAKDGKIIWLGSRGYADLENSVPATQKTIYRIASVSKPITAVAVMQLFEQGKIHLDADVRSYLPYLPAYRWKFTTRQLLSHTSGIRDYRKGEFDSKDYFKSTREVVDYLDRDTLVYEPGSRYLYSTLAYNLLAAIIENVSGMSYPDFIKKRILIPAGMSSTSIEVQKELITNRAHGYVKNEERKFINAPLADLSIKYSGGGIISTAEDLLKFSTALLQGKLIKHSTLDTMLVPVKLRNGKYSNYGLGFAFGTNAYGKKYFMHSGTGTGFSSMLIIYPTDKISAVYLINSRDRNLENPAVAMSDIVMKLPYSLPKKSLSEYLLSIYLRSSIDSAITVLKNLKNSPNDYDMSPEELRYFGTDLLAMNKIVDAIKYHKFFISEHPHNLYSYLGLADAYYRDGNIGLAINSYRMALRIDPLNSYADNMIHRLNGNKN